MRKLATVGLSVATAISLTGAGALMPVAGADLLADLQAQLADIQAQIAALTGGAAEGCYNFTVDLTVGSTGADVTALQDYLTGTGHFTFSGGSTGYFGPITQAAVAAWQAANGVSPAVGYFGPLSRAQYNSMCTPADEDEDVEEMSEDLEGGAGSVEQYSLVSEYNNEKVGEDEEDVIVAGLEIEADENSDLRFTAVKLDFDQGTAGSDWEKYADEVSVWWGDDEIGRADADKFNDDNAFDATMSLDMDGKLEAGEKGELLLAVSGIGNLDSTDAGDTWTVDFTSLRFVDAQGASTAEDPSTNARTFSFETFATAGNTEFKVSLGDDDSINEAHVIDVHATDDTDMVPILNFETEIEGDYDVVLDDLLIDVVVTGASHVDDMINALYAYMDGDEVGSSSVGSDCDEDADCVDVGSDEQYKFEDMDLTLEPGTYDWIIYVDLLSVADDLDEGDTIYAQLTETEMDDATFDIEDQTGEDLADADTTGTATGDAHAVYDNGINVEFVSSSATKNAGDAQANEDDEGTFTIIFDVTAFGSDIYIPDGATSATIAAGNANGAGFTVTDGTLTTTEVSDLDHDGTNGSNSNFKVKEDQTNRFTLTVTLDANTGTAANAEIALNGLVWSTTDKSTGTNLYNFNLDEFETAPIKLTARAS